jgi:hypothetical protein
MLLDTTPSRPGYHQVSDDIIYSEHKYEFHRLDDVDKYWYEMWNFCIHTHLGMSLWRNSSVFNRNVATALYINALWQKTHFMQQFHTYWSSFVPFFLLHCLSLYQSVGDDICCADCDVFNNWQPIIPFKQVINWRQYYDIPPMFMLGYWLPVMVTYIHTYIHTYIDCSKQFLTHTLNTSCDHHCRAFIVDCLQYFLWHQESSESLFINWWVRNITDNDSNFYRASYLKWGTICVWFRQVHTDFFKI